MPGIVGLITKMPRERAKPQLLRMVETLRHESFYEVGTWTDESLGVYVGWAAQSGSFSDAMPLLSERRDFCLVFSGEEYPEPGTARGLKDRGHDVEMEGPSYLVHLAEEDPSFPAHLNGQFHGLLTDRTRRTAMLFNDRYGMRRVYYHESEDAFYFAAEAKAILAVCPEFRKLDPRGLGEFVSCGCVLENRTLFENVHVLPPASAWVFRDGAIDQKRTYFHPREWEEQAPLSPQAYYQELRDVFSRNLPRYFNGHQRIGVALTGGLDTRAIMAWAQAPPQTLPCYTFGGPYRDCQDVKVARRVAELCKQSHQAIRVGEEFLRNFPRYAERTVSLSEGAVDLARSSDLYVSERAREIAPVKVIGTYGSEILCRVVMFKPQSPLPGLFRSGLFPYIHQAGATYEQFRGIHPVTFAAFHQFPWCHYGVIAVEQSQLAVRSPYLDNEFVRTAYRISPSNGANGDVRLRLIGDGTPALAQIRTDRGVGGNRGNFASAISRGFLEFTFKAEYAYDYGMPQWVARIDHLFSPLHLERLFLGRHKLTHFRIWYRDALSSYVREILLDPLALSRPYLNRKGVETVVHDHLKGSRNYTSEIHKLLTLELLQRLFIDGN